jgi:hydroxymethylpyrimidine/phosphomethylpyrimidine kinase
LVDAGRNGGPPPTALTIAGSDSSGGAGIQADLKTFAELGVWGLSVVTSVTSQNSSGVCSVFNLPAEVVSAQLDAVLSDGPVRAAKTGMLATKATVEAVAAAVSSFAVSPLVVDPVLAASDGHAFLDPDGVRSLIEDLLPLAEVVTPNVPEAEALTGLEIRTVRDMEAAARVLSEMGAASVLLKGGHLGGDRSPDVLWSEGSVHQLDAARLGPSGAHGTGCVLSSALAAFLAFGLPLLEACERAKGFVSEALGAAVATGRGRLSANPSSQVRPPS